MNRHNGGGGIVVASASTLIPTLGQERFDLDRRLTKWMLEHESASMQRDDAIARKLGRRPERPGAAIERVAQHRVAAMRCLHSQLMHAAGARRQFQQRRIAIAANDAKERDRLLGPVGIRSDDLSSWCVLHLADRSIVVQDRAGAAVLGEQRVAAVAEQVQVEVSLASFLLSPMTSMVMVFVVSPGAKVSVPVLAPCSPCRRSWRCRHGA
jgi:hypothetical protein